MRLDDQLKNILSESAFTEGNAEWMRRHFKAAIERAEALEDLSEALEKVLAPKPRSRIEDQP